MPDINRGPHPEGTVFDKHKIGFGFKNSKKATAFMNISVKSRAPFSICRNVPCLASLSRNINFLCVKDNG